jgi:hypothetical protein
LVKKLGLQDRPAAFNHMVAVINDQPVFLSGDNEVWQLGTKGFEKLMSLVGGGVDLYSGTYAFEPVAGTSKIVVYMQSCGQGCSKPQLTIFDYLERSYKPVEPSPEVLDKLNPDPTADGRYTELTFKEFINNQAVFWITYPSQYVVTFDYATSQWSVRAAKTGEVVTTATVTHCNPVYEFVNNRFSVGICPKVVGQYQFEISSHGDRPALKQTNTATKETLDLKPVLAAKPYTPFEGEFYNTMFQFALLANNKFWLGTNLGLGAYDPVSANWDLFDNSRGLTSNSIRSFAVTANALWVVTENGGLAGIKL